MFTGIIEEIGKIKQVIPIAGGKSILIECSKVLEDISVNDSICVSGVCLTATKLEANGFWVDAVGATLVKSTFSEIKLSTPVNLERSMRLSDRLGGHLVQGHVNGVGIVSEIKKLGENYMVSISAPSELEKYLVKEGSITIDGISLTIADLPARPSGGKESATGGLVAISVIPHTWQNTTIQYKNSGSMVNIEIDILAKYVEKLLHGNDTGQKKLLSENWLKELGY